MLRGLLVVVPLYLAVLLLLKGMKTVAGLVRPFALLLPDWFPAEQALSLLLVLCPLDPHSACRCRLRSRAETGAPSGRVLH
jgi:hypothetical protein